MRFSRILFIFLFVFVGNFTKAGAQTKELNQDKMIEYSKSKDFAYMKYIPQDTSMWDDFNDWLNELLNKLVGTKSAKFTWDFLWIVAMIIILSFAIYMIVKMRYSQGITRVNSEPTTLEAHDVRNYSSVDYDKFINDSLSQNDFRQAIRYTYLRLLYSLDKNEKINYKTWKSPQEYRYEVKFSEGAGKAYDQLIHLFECVWYGEFDAENEHYLEGSRLATMIETESAS